MDTAQGRQALQQVIKNHQSHNWYHLPSIGGIVVLRCVHRAKKILDDTLLSRSLFNLYLLPYHHCTEQRLMLLYLCSYKTCFCVA